jgi:hypothetical protein
MPHTMVTFRLHRSGVILLVVFCVVLVVLVYAAGVLTAGSWNAGRGFSPPPPVARAPVVAPAPAGGGLKPRPTLKAAAPGESLTLRVAVLTSEEDAKAELANLTAMGLKPAVVQMVTTSGVTLHNVVVGHFETRAAANAAAKELQSRLGFLPVVIPAPVPPNL